MAGDYLVVGGDDGWGEIVNSTGIGEMTRGGGGPATDTLLSNVIGAAVPGQPGYDVLGQALAASPAFQQLVAKKAAASRPIMHKQPLRMARDWDVPLGPVSGAAGTQTTISFQPQAYFRVEKMMCTDTATTAGTGTAIAQILVGQRLQRPATGGATLSLFYSNNALGNGVRWDTCQPAFSIALTISFVLACTFYGNLFGKAVI